MKWTILVISIFVMIACNHQQEKQVQGQWIQGTETQKIEIIEKQFRGFDMAMVETGYRYTELYWAGEDQNWEYAAYQLNKIKKTISNGLERRPKRAKSAQHFLNEIIPQMREAIVKKDTAVFDDNFKMLTNACTNCHKMEKVPTFLVKKPLNRVSPIRK